MNPSSSTAKEMRRCQYRDRAGLPGKDCLGEFEISGQGGTNRLHCDNCQVLATRDRGRKHAARKRSERPPEARGFKKRLCKGWKFKLKPNQIAKCKEPLPCLGSFKPTNGRERFCDNCALNRRRALQGALALEIYHRDKKQKSGPGRKRHLARLRRGRKSAAAYHKKQRELIQKFKNGELVPKAQASPKATTERKSGRPKGMTPETLEEARLLEKYIREFEEEQGMKRGALKYACQKVYGKGLDQHKAFTRGNKTLERYRALGSARQKTEKPIIFVH